MSYQPAPAGPMTFGGPFSPALAKLRNQLSRETATCWLLIALTALCITPVAYMLISVTLQIIPFMLHPQLNPFGTAQPSGSLDMFTALASIAGSIFGSLVALVPPAFIIIWALLINRRIYSLTVRDLLWGGVALCLVDEAYSHVVEEAKRQRYRPNPNPVKPGEGFAGRLNHFAYHYKQYYRLSYGPNDLQVPLVIQANCWAEGSIMACLACSCAGAMFAIPLVLRTILVWPRVIAIKQATIDFLAGKFDSDLEQMAQARDRQASPPQRTGL